MGRTARSGRRSTVVHGSWAGTQHRATVLGGGAGLSKVLSHPLEYFNGDVATVKLGLLNVRCGLVRGHSTNSVTITDTADNILQFISGDPANPGVINYGSTSVGRIASLANWNVTADPSNPSRCKHYHS